jgi:hypothetical protein
MRRLSEQWPLDTPDRAALAEFLVIHIIRTPAFGVFARRSGLRAVRDVAQRHGLTPDQVAAATRRAMGPHKHANALLGQVGRIGGVFCSMSWALVQFAQRHPHHERPARDSAPLGSESYYASILHSSDDLG